MGPARKLYLRPKPADSSMASTSLRSSTDLEGYRGRASVLKHVWLAAGRVYRVSESQVAGRKRGRARTGQMARRRTRHLDPELEVREALSRDPVRASDKGEQPALAVESEVLDDLPEGAGRRQSRRRSVLFKRSNEKHSWMHLMSGSFSLQPSYRVTIRSWATSSGSGEPRTQSSISSGEKIDSALPSTTESQPRWNARNWRATLWTRWNWTSRSTNSCRFEAVTGMSSPPGMSGIETTSPKDSYLR